MLTECKIFIETGNVLRVHQRTRQQFFIQHQSSVNACSAQDDAVQLSDGLGLRVQCVARLEEIGEYSCMDPRIVDKGVCLAIFNHDEHAIEQRRQQHRMY